MGMEQKQWKTIVGFMGMLVFMFTCLHIMYIIFPSNSVNDLRSLLNDDLMTVEKDDDQNVSNGWSSIDFSTHEHFNKTVLEWKDSAMTAIDLINTWKDYDTAAEELDSNMRNQLETNGWFCKIKRRFSKNLS